MAGIPFSYFIYICARLFEGHLSESACVYSSARWICNRDAGSLRHRHLGKLDARRVAHCLNVKGEAVIRRPVATREGLLYGDALVSAVTAYSSGGGLIAVGKGEIQPVGVWCHHCSHIVFVQTNCDLHRL